MNDVKLQYKKTNIKVFQGINNKYLSIKREEKKQKMTKENRKKIDKEKMEKGLIFEEE